MATLHYISSAGPLGSTGLVFIGSQKPSLSRLLDAQRICKLLSRDEFETRGVLIQNHSAQGYLLLLLGATLVGPTSFDQPTFRERQGANQCDQ